jgi:hypothetical protein
MTQKLGNWTWITVARQIFGPFSSMTNARGWVIFAGFIISWLLLAGVVVIFAKGFQSMARTMG